MGVYTSRYALYLPAGGSTGQITGDDQVDIDKLNASFRTIDAALGLPYLSRSGVSSPVASSLLKDPSDNELYTYINGQWVTALPDRLSAATLANTYVALANPGALDSRYYTQVQLQAGSLDTIYPRTAGLTAGALDWRYTRHASNDATNNAFQAGSIAVSATTADSDGSHTGFSGTFTVTVANLTSITAFVAQPQRASSFEIHWSTKSVSANVVVLYFWSSNSVSNITFNWIAIGTAGASL